MVLDNIFYIKSPTVKMFEAAPEYYIGICQASVYLSIFVYNLKSEV